MATSVHRVSRLNNIWSSDWVLGVPALATIFPRNQFWQLWSNLHLSDNTQASGCSDPSFDRLYKLRPLLRILADAFRAAHEPSQQISVDEAMVRYKGRSSLEQYMPKKPIKRGFKIWCLCDANGGYMQEFQIYTGTNNAYMCKVPIIFTPFASESLHLIFVSISYCTGKETNSANPPPGKGLTYRVVTDLCDNYSGNYITSYRHACPNARMHIHTKLLHIQKSTFMHALIHTHMHIQVTIHACKYAHMHTIPQACMHVHIFQ